MASTLVFVRMGGPLLAGLEVLDVAVHLWTVREIALRRIDKS